MSPLETLLCHCCYAVINNPLRSKEYTYITVSVSVCFAMNAVMGELFACIFTSWGHFPAVAISVKCLDPVILLSQVEYPKVLSRWSRDPAQDQSAIFIRAPRSE